MKYTFSPFNSTAAALGAMCILLSEDYPEDKIDSSNNNCFGIGVCNNPTDGVFIFSTAKGAFPFNSKGIGTSFISKNKVLKLLSSIGEGDVEQSDIISKLDNLDHSAEDIYSVLKDVRDMVEKTEVVITYTDNE